MPNTNNRVSPSLEQQRLRMLQELVEEELGFEMQPAAAVAHEIESNEREVQNRQRREEQDHIARERQSLDEQQREAMHNANFLSNPNPDVDNDHSELDNSLSEEIITQVADDSNPSISENINGGIAAFYNRDFLSEAVTIAAPVHGIITSEGHAEEGEVSPDTTPVTNIENQIGSDFRNR